MTVSLISKTCSEDKTAQDLIAYTARVSNPSNQSNPDTEKLIQYLIKHKHWSPFEMVSICLEINTTRDIARQILRHRSFSFQEFSQRYADASQLGFTLRECRLQDTKNRQNSIDIEVNTDVSFWWAVQQNKVLSLVKEVYAEALQKGIAKEQARAILPEGLTNSRLYMNGTLRSWIHFCTLRMSNGTQKEHSLIAKECWEVLKKEFPIICSAVESLET
jgi:thymidylate synthase (FAD)